jgi:hypothetical protein
MSLQGLDDLNETWTLRNSLTINNDLVVEGDVNTSGFIYDGGIPVNILTTNNIWSGKNNYSVDLPTYLQPLANTDMATKLYLDTEIPALGVGETYLATANVWTKTNDIKNQNPLITGTAIASTSQAVNKSVADFNISSVGNTIFSSANVWNGTNNFTNQIFVENPVNDFEFANKSYVDTAVSNFNASGGKVEYVEYTTFVGTETFTCDPAIYSGCTIIAVSMGGYGTTDGIATGANIKSYGGSGSMIAFKIPAFTGTANINTTIQNYNVVGQIVITFPNGLLLALYNGTNGTASAVGTGGTYANNYGLQGVQYVLGGTEILQNPIVDDSINYSYNIAVLNGFGRGGSFNYLTGALVNPTGFYFLQIKYKN